MTKEEWLKLAENWEKMSPEEYQRQWLKAHPDTGHHRQHAIDMIDKSDWDDYLCEPGEEITVIKKTMLPPTDKQKERIKELKDRPEFSGEHLDWLLDAIQNRNMLNTRGQAGILIDQMKKRIRAAGGDV